MQFSISLQKKSKNGFLPFSYQYEVSSAIYKILERADPAYSHFLHTEGYQLQHKRFKPFTFSMLQFDTFKAHKIHQRLEHTGQTATLQIRFTVDKAAEEFIKGLFMHQQLGIGDKLSRVDYEVVRIDSLEMPVFETRMRYHSLSPIFISAMRPNGHAEYLSPEDPRYEQLLRNNLIDKTLSFQEAGNIKGMHGSEDKFKFTLLGKPKSKVITFKAFTENPIKLKAYLFDFELEAPVELQEIGYYGGFGGKSAQGLGCVEIID